MSDRQPAAYGHRRGFKSRSLQPAAGHGWGTGFDRKPPPPGTTRAYIIIIVPKYLGKPLTNEEDAIADGPFGVSA